MAISNNIPLSPLKLKWFTKKSKTFCTLGSHIFKTIDDKDNFAIINSNLKTLFGYITHYSTKYIVPINTFIKTENINFKVRFHNLMIKFQLITYILLFEM